MVAAGPFTTIDDLTYQPLFDLLSDVQSLHPDVLILIGPFLDVDHPHLSDPEKAFNLNSSVDTLFTQVILDVVRVIAPLRTKLVVVPSTRGMIKFY